MEKDTFVEEAARYANKMVDQIGKVEYIQILEARDGEYQNAIRDLREARRFLDGFLAFLEKRTAK